MATILHPKDFLGLFKCACGSNNSLEETEETATCGRCNRTYPIKLHILQLVDPELLDTWTSKELQGNTFPLEPDRIKLWAEKDQWSLYYAYFSKKKFGLLLKYLRRTKCTRIFSLGSGTGYEVKCLSQMYTFDTVFCSDLSFSALCVTPHTLKDIPINLGLFTSDLNACPILPKDIPILVYEALHHTKNMSLALDRLMKAGYEEIMFVEPADNFLIRWLSRRGLARRIEYSGVKPGRLPLKDLRALGKKHKYAVSLSTMWEFPEDYFRRFSKSQGLLQRLFFMLLDGLSAVTRPFKFGNICVAYLRKS